MEVEDLHNSRVQEDVISRSETRVKELENTLRVEERSANTRQRNHGDGRAGLM